MNKSRNYYTFAIVLSAMMIALSVVLKIFTPYLPIGGALVLRLDFYGPFEKLVPLLFGPLYGGIAGGLVDVIGYFIKPMGSFNPFLTMTAILNCVAFGLLWKVFKKIKSTYVEMIYIGWTIFILVFGIFNTVIMNLGSASKYKSILEGFGEKVYFLTFISIIIGAIGLIIYIVVALLRKRNDDTDMPKYFFKLFIALIIPGIIFSLINTRILMIMYPQITDSSFYIFAIPRLITQMIETLYETYLLVIIILLGRNVFRNYNLDVDVN